MAVVIPYKIDQEDQEKWGKRILAGLPAADRSRINKDDYGSIIGPTVSPARLRIDIGDFDKVLKVAAASAT